MKRFLCGVAGCVLALSAMSAWADGQVNIICSVQMSWCQAVGAAFTKETGINVGIVQKSAGEAMAQIAAERANPKLDVYYTGTGDLHLQAGTTRMRCTVENLPLPGGRYWLWVGVFDRTGSPLSAWHAACAFDVAGPALDAPPPAVVLRAPVYVGSVWEIEPEEWDAFLLVSQGFTGKEAAAKLNMRVADVYLAKSKIMQMLKREIKKLDQSG